MSMDVPIMYLTDILISEADSRSIPSPGPELLKKVEEARENHEFPAILDSSVLRFIDGMWMAPQMCKG